MAHLEDNEGTADQVTMSSFGPAAAASTMSGGNGALLGIMDAGVVDEASPHPAIWFLENMRTKYWLPVSSPVISYSPPYISSCESRRRGYDRTRRETSGTVFGVFRASYEGMVILGRGSLNGRNRWVDSLPSTYWFH